jgi:hypothetical protein
LTNARLEFNHSLNCIAGNYGTKDLLQIKVLTSHTHTHTHTR